MALIEVQTKDGPRKVRVCDYCRTVCTTSRFCSGRCARSHDEREQQEARTAQHAADAAYYRWQDAAEGGDDE